MNAYELADAIEDWATAANYNISIKAGQMLRAQAKRIEELEKVSSKPTAWMDYVEHSDFYDLNVSGRGIPLYTAPRELSDEEIEECIVAWVKEIYGNEYVTPSDSHITQGTRLIKLAEEMRLNK